MNWKHVAKQDESPTPWHTSPIRPCDVRAQVTTTWEECACVCVCGFWARQMYISSFSSSRPYCVQWPCILILLCKLHIPSLNQHSGSRCSERQREWKGTLVDVVPLLCLVVHVDKDGGGGDGSHGGALVEGRVGRDQIRTQVRTKNTWGEIIHMHMLSVKGKRRIFFYNFPFSIFSSDPYSICQVCNMCTKLLRLWSSRSTGTLHNFFHTWRRSTISNWTFFVKSSSPEIETHMHTSANADSIISLESKNVQSNNLMKTPLYNCIDQNVKPTLDHPQEARTSSYFCISIVDSKFKQVYWLKQARAQ